MIAILSMWFLETNNYVIQEIQYFGGQCVAIEEK